MTERFRATLAAAAGAGEISKSTHGSYRRAGERFIAFAEERGLDPTAPDALATYLAGLEDGSIPGPKSAVAMTRAAFKWLARRDDTPRR